MKSAAAPPRFDPNTWSPQCEEDPLLWHQRWQFEAPNRPLWDGKPIPFGRWFLRSLGPMYKPGTDELVDAWVVVPPHLTDQSGAVYIVFTGLAPGQAFAAALGYVRTHSTVKELHS